MTARPADVSDRIEAGEPVFMEFVGGRRSWWVENPYEEVPSETIRALGNRLCERGDSLFGWPGFSQTWFASPD